ncbi:hypothetical protein HII36_42155 [Nonomuraea sp. NN258]|uniref:hypothetical protein n=1 Tax=Nonomuraea antri TaxID=2730852 RepID=UPI0015682BCA|nr:hypothetical protein [Nonomuraea antri]NRQ38389.1 hypothetical protein [Nonomuraea antri]
MSEDIHPASRREGPAESAEPEKPEVPLDTSLPDVCRDQPLCFALHVQSEGGMSWLLGGLVFQWAVYLIAWTAGGIWWMGFPGLALMLGATVPPLVWAFAVYRRQGHRGWCWVLRSIDPDMIALVLSSLVNPFRWIELIVRGVVWPLRWLFRALLWIGRILSAL